VTPPEPEAVPDEEAPDTESPPKKLLRRDHELPDPPDPPDEYPRAEQLVAVCGDGAIPGDAGAAIPGDAGWQLVRGISA
jgi:hypothetical protein